MRTSVPRLAAILMLVGCQAAPPATGAASTPAPPTELPTIVSAPTDPPPAITPPGPTGRLAFQRSGPEGGIFVIQADGSQERRILRGTYGTPRWSPDASRLALYQETDGHVSVHLVKADGSGLLEVTLPEGLDCGLAVWTPDGMQLAVECWSEADPDLTGIYLVAIDGKAPARRLTKGHGLPSEFSSDGERLLFAREAGGLLAEVDVDGAAERTISQLSIGQMPGYFGLGQFYVVSDGAIRILNPTGTVARTIVAPELKIVEARLSPDRTFFAFIYDPAAAVAPGLYRMAVDGSRFGPIVHTNIDGIQEEHPDWMP